MTPKYTQWNKNPFCEAALKRMPTKTECVCRGAQDEASDRSLRGAARGAEQRGSSHSWSVCSTRLPRTTHTHTDRCTPSHTSGRLPWQLGKKWGFNPSFNFRLKVFLHRKCSLFDLQLPAASSELWGFVSFLMNSSEIFLYSFLIQQPTHVQCSSRSCEAVTMKGKRLRDGRNGVGT